MKQQQRRKQFTFYASYYDAIHDLPASRRYETLDAMICYALDGTLPTGLKGSARAVFRAIRPNLDSSRVKAETALRKGRDDESPFCELREEPAEEAEPEGAGKPKKKKKMKNQFEEEREEEKEKERKREKEGSADPVGEGGCGGPAAAGACAGLSLPEKEMKSILLKTPLIGQPPYDAMFRQDPLLIYFWKDAATAGPEGGPLPEAEQRSLLTELLALPDWERPARLNERLLPRHPDLLARPDP